jgi:hypothetical protein
VALAPVPSADEIVRLYKSGELPAELAQYHETGDGDENVFLQRCIALHNSKDIDLVVLPSQAAFAQLRGHEFFTAQHLYCEAIPRLDSDVSALMECCRILVEKADNDGAANLPNGAFRTWCQHNPSKGASVIQDAQTGDALAKRFATFALQAANDIDSAIKFVKTYDDDRRLSGMAALAGMSFADPASAQRAVKVLEPYVAERSDDHVRVNALLAAFDVLKQHEDAVAAHRLIKSGIKEPGPELLHGLARIVWLHHKMLDSHTLRDALTALEAVNPDHLGTVQQIDIGLRQLLGTRDEPLVLDFLTAKLQDPKLKIDNFPVIAHDLTKGDEERLYKLIVRWFLSGSIALCDNVSDLVGIDKNRAFDTTVQPLGLTAAQQIFLCHKAIGFLFTKPVICCSIIVSVLRAENPDVEGHVADLLFDPMLLNYGGEAKDYLKSIPATDATHGAIQKALAKDEAFYARVEAAGTIKDLHPSDYQRDVEHQRTYDSMRQIHKAAMTKSVLMNLVHRSTILYGKRSLTFAEDTDGKRRAVEMDLKPFSTSWELPRHEILDPVGLDYMIRVFRVAKLK